MTNHTRALLEQVIAALTHEGHFPWSDKQYFVEALKAELAKPEQKNPITLDQFRAIAHRMATTYRHRSDPEKSSYAFVDGSSLDDFWRKVCEAIQPTSAWHDAPETLALKAERDAAMKDAERYRWLCGQQPWSEALGKSIDAAIANEEGGAV